MPEIDIPAVRFNELSLPWSPGLTVAELLLRQGLAPEAVATALNGAFVPRAQRESTLLRAGDQLTAFQAIVGG